MRYGKNFTNKYLDVFVIQYYYRNEELDQNIIDDTSLVFQLTTELREFDIGALTVGGIPEWQSMALVI